MKRPNSKLLDKICIKEKQMKHQRHVSPNIRNCGELTLTLRAKSTLKFGLANEDYVQTPLDLRITQQNTSVAALGPIGNMTKHFPSGFKVPESSRSGSPLSTNRCESPVLKPNIKLTQ